MFLPPAPAGVQPSDGSTDIEHKITRAVHKQQPAKSLDEPTGETHGGSVSVNVEHHVSQATTNSDTGTAANVQTSTNVETNGDAVSSSNHATSTSHSAVVSTNNSSHVVKSGSGNDSVTVHVSTNVSHGAPKVPSHDDWSDWSDDLQDSIPHR